MSSSRGRYIAGLLMAAGIGISIFLFMPRGYGKISPRAYEIASALYSVCLAKSPDRLEKFDGLLEDDPRVSNGNESTVSANRGNDPAAVSDSPNESDLTPQERMWLSSIVELARKGKWELAVSKLRRMLEDQVQK